MVEDFVKCLVSVGIGTGSKITYLEVSWRAITTIKGDLGGA